jgi:hypothetical protein
MPARRRRAPTVRFITFDTLVTGVRAFECAFSVRTSSFVHGLTTRRDDLAGFAVLANFEFLAVFFRALGIIQVLQLNAVHIGMRCGDSKAVVNVGTCGTIHAHVQRTTTYSHGCEENLAISRIDFPLSRRSRRIRPIVSTISIPPPASRQSDRE